VDEKRKLTTGNADPEYGAGVLRALGFSPETTSR